MSRKPFQKISDTFKKISGNAVSHQIGVFLIFLVISAVLWLVSSLNEVVQRNVECEIVVTDVPDSVTFLSQPPSNLTANVRSRGTRLLRQFFGVQQVIKLDFRYFHNATRLSVPKKNLVEMVQQSMGDDVEVVDVSPDSIGVYFTTLPPVRLPVKIEAVVTTTPNVCLYGPLKCLTDSVSVYAIGSVARNLREISTVRTKYTDVGASETIKVPLDVPAGCRAIPDSVEVAVKVEPVVTEMRYVPVEAVNVPEGVNIVFVPAKIQASYRVPRSQRYNLPEIHVIADYNSIGDDLSQNKISVSTSQLLPNVFLQTDSVDYYINSDNYTDSVSRK